MENQELIQQMKLGVLKDTFTQHPETSVKQYKVDSRWCRFIHGVESEEELWEREYTNGDLVMRTREAVGEMVATILDLKIIDTKASKLLSL